MYVFVITIGLVIAEAWYQGVVPFFPIEISRCASSTASTQWAFEIGAIVSTAWFLLVHKWTWAYCVALAGFHLLVWANDEDYWWIHMAGVAIMAVGFVLCVTTWQQFALLVCAGLMYFGRIAIRALILWAVEPGPVIANYNNMMMSGVHTQKATLVVFQTTALLQWLAFYMCARALL